MRLRLVNGICSRSGQITSRFLSRSCLSLNQKTSQQQEYLEEYKIRTLLERPIEHYSRKKFAPVSLSTLVNQSQQLDQEFIMKNARDSVERLLAFTARGLKEFRKLPYLVVLNPSISQGYQTYLQSMTLLLNSTLKFPTTIEENEMFTEKYINGFLNLHSDTLPSLSKGFNEVLSLLSEQKVKTFLDNHLRERISMRLIAHQHVCLTNTFNDKSKFEPGSSYNGTVQPLDIVAVIKKNADLINDIFFLKYDQTIPIEFETDKSAIIFPYIEYHLDYIFSELFKNSFRSQVEANILDPVLVTIVSSDTDLQIRIRDKGKGIPESVLNHIFDYSFTTFDNEEGDSYKTLNVPPGDAGNVVAGMGYGLPLLMNYIETFNNEDTISGLLALQTYPGCGTDIYLKIKVV